MSNEFNIDFERIYGKLLDILSAVHQSEDRQIKAFDEEWQMNVFKPDEMVLFQTDSNTEMKNQRLKLFKKASKCIVFGETSAGKSTMINALLNRDDLPNKCGWTKNCFVEISSSDKTIVRINDEEKDIESLKELINFTSENHLPSGSHVNLFYKKEDCSFLEENMTIIDIPGIDTDADIDDKIVKYCTEADIIILVINATLCVKGTVKKFINKFQTRFTELNLFLVFNHCDRLDNDIDKEKVEGQLMKGAETIFHEELKHPIDVIKDRSFFISAKDRLEINKNKEFLNGDTNRMSRNDEFDRLMNKLQEKMKEDGVQRRYGYLEGLYNVVKVNVERYEDLMNQMNDKISRVSADAVTILSDFSYSKSQIVEVLKPACTNIIGKLIEFVNPSIQEPEEQQINQTGWNRSLTYFRIDALRNESRNYNFLILVTLIDIWILLKWICANVFRKAKGLMQFILRGDRNEMIESVPCDRIRDKLEIRRRLIIWLFEEIGGDLEDLREEIKEYIKLNKKDDLKYPMLILKRFYFPFYLNKELLESYVIPKTETMEVEYPEDIGYNMIGSTVDLNLLILELHQMSGKNIISKILNYFSNNFDDISSTKLREINYLNNKSQRDPILILEQLLHVCFVDPPIQPIDSNFKIIILKWIQQELNEKYLEFLESIGDKLKEQFELKFRNGSSTDTINKIKKDLEDVKKEMDSLSPYIFN